LPHIMQSRHVLHLLIRLFNFGPHFHLSQPMSKAWVTKNLMATAGGVRLLFHFYYILLLLNFCTVHHGLCQLLSRLLDRSSFTGHSFRNPEEQARGLVKLQESRRRTVRHILARR
jgi:hypothetical protein